MTPLEKALAAKPTAECPTPVPASTPDPQILVDGTFITTPAIQSNPQVVLTNTGEAFLSQLQASSQLANMSPASGVVSGAFVSATGSRKGYQWAGGILRPDVFGRYVARNPDETAFLQDLLAAGELVAQGTGSIYPITM